MLIKITAALNGQYENLIFYNRIMTFKIVLWAIWAGLVIGVAVSFYTKDYLGRFIRRLLKKEAFFENKALTFEELGYRKTFPIRIHLKDGGSLRRYVDVSNKEESIENIPCSKKISKLRDLLGLEKEYKKYHFSTMKFFIPEEKKYAADVRY